MKKIHLLFALLCLTGTAITAQCTELTSSCPGNETYQLKSGQRDTTILVIPPDTMGCKSQLLYYTISGPSVKVGAGLPGSFTFLPGESEVNYAYTDKRFGSFFDDPIELPDNTRDTFKIPLSIENAGSSTTVQQAGGIVKVCFVMEHSYLGDLDMYITCPDGSTAFLHTYNPNDDVTRQLLGEGNQFTSTPDPGALYCWTVSGERTMAEYVTDFDLGDNVQMPSIDYAPEESFSVFDQCLINGDWTLNVLDNLSNDNGSVSSAYIDFEDVTSVCAQSIKVDASTTGLFDRAPSPTFSLSAFPNPATDVFRLKVDARRSGSARLEVFSVDGKKLYTRTVDLLAGENTYPVTTADWPVGVYSVRVASGGAEQWVRVVKAL